LDEVDRFTRDQHLDKAAFLREVIRRGLERAREELVLKRYSAKELSIGEASERLRINRWEFFELLKTHNTYLNLDLEDLLSASRLEDRES
jgi:predicted HTH domain antitoxin